MRFAGLVLGLVCLGTAGVGLEVARPALFPSEALVVWTAPGEGPPTASFAGTPWPMRWHQVAERERVRWEGSFPSDAPLGVWLVCTDRECYAFLRVAADQGLVEVEAVPGAVLTLGEQVRIGNVAGRAFFVVPPGDHLLTAQWHGETVTRMVSVRREQRARETLILATAEVSTAVALPGHTVTLFVRIVAPRDLPSLGADLVLPEGWEAVANPGLHDPLPAGRMSVRSWRVSIPADAAYAEYLLAVGLPELGTQAQIRLTVAHRLSPLDVVRHWDIDADRLDLSLSGEVTFDRLRWAAAFVGQVLPFTGRVFTQDELEALAEEWRRGP